MYVFCCDIEVNVVLSFVFLPLFCCLLNIAITLVVVLLFLYSYFLLIFYLLVDFLLLVVAIVFSFQGVFVFCCDTKVNFVVSSHFDFSLLNIAIISVV